MQNDMKSIKGESLLHVDPPVVFEVNTHTHTHSLKIKSINFYHAFSCYLELFNKKQQHEQEQILHM